MSGAQEQEILWSEDCGETRGYLGRFHGGETCEEHLQNGWDIDKHRGASGASLAEKECEQVKEMI